MLPHGIRKSLTLKTPPAFDTSDATKCVVSLASAKNHLRVDFADDDDEIGDVINLATQYMDGAAGVLGRALLTQSWEMRLDGFQALEAPRFMVPGNILATGIIATTSGRLRLPLPPTATVDSIKYVDVDGALQTLDPSIYQLVSGGNIGRSYLAPAYNQYWPAHRLTDDAVRIAFTAGYGDGSTVPPGIRHAAKLLIKHFYDNREPVLVSDTRAVALPIPLMIDALLAPYTIDWF